jgi:hypothetical protein
LALAQANNVDVLYTFGATPDWAASGSGPQCPYSPGSCYPPADVQDWDNFVTALVAHSAGRIKYWELWNEPNLDAFWTGDLPTLVLLAQHAYRIIKTADPTSVVLSPSATGAATDLANFLNAYFAAGGLPYTDAVAFHGYPSTPEDLPAMVAGVKGAMASNGAAGKPIWNTEGSWGSNSNIAIPIDQGGFLARAYLLQWSSGVSRFYWYAWNNTLFGTLWKAVGGIQPGGIAYGLIDKWMVGATLSTPCAMASNSTWTCTFTRPGDYQSLAVWNSSTTVNYTPASQYKQYLDLAGNTVQVNGPVSIGYNPILLVSTPPPAPPTGLSVTGTQ